MTAATTGLARVLCCCVPLLLGGCMASNPSRAQQSASPGERQLGGSELLDRPDLQAIVDLQTRRDTAAVLGRLTDADEAVRGRAALALGSIRAPDFVGQIIPLLIDPDSTVRAHAAFAVGQSGSVLAIAPLIDALHRETAPTVLEQIAHALGRVGDRPALAALAGADLPPSAEPARAIAIARFGMRGEHDPTAVRHLAGLLLQEDPATRRSAAYYFGRITDVAPWMDQVAAVSMASERLNVDDEAQLFLSTALGRLRDAAHVPTLLRLLRESADWRIRTNSARALSGDWVHEEGISALIAALDDDSHHVGVAAAGSLAIPQLSDAHLDRLHDWLRAHASEWQVWTAFLPALVVSGRIDDVGELVSDLPAAARAGATRALGADPTVAGLRRLVDATADPEPRVAAAAVDALRARWQREQDTVRVDAYLEAFAAALRRGGAPAFAAAGALGDTLFIRMGAGDVLRETYAELPVARNVGALEAIIRAHGLARDTVALDFLVSTAVEARHPVLRRAATAALTERFGEGYLFTSIGGRAPTFPQIAWEYLQSLGPAPRLVLETERGTVVLELATEWAPATVQAITRFATEGRYDGVEFHRVVPNFVIQGGDFEPGDGFGGPDFFLPSEFTPLPYETGTLGMASSGPDTEGSQFFVTHSMQPHLEGNYTVFGRVRAGQQVVDAIRVGDRVLRASVEASR